MIHVRLLRPADAPAYKILRDAALKSAPTAFTSDHASESLRSAQSYIHRLGDPQEDPHVRACTFGAWEGDRLCGALTLERHARLQTRHRVDVLGMMVDEAVQGQGIGQRLLRKALSDVRRLWPMITLVTLSVSADNPRAVRLYEQAGFTPYGRLPGAIVVNGQPIDKLLMQRTFRI